MSTPLDGMGEVALCRVVARLSLRALALGRAVRTMEVLGALVGWWGDGRRSLSRGEAMVRVAEVEALSERWIPRRGGLRGRCLERSLVRHAMLRARGVGSGVRIGVSLEGGSLRAHAWNMVDSDVLFREEGVDRWSPIYDSREDVRVGRPPVVTRASGAKWMTD